MGMVRYACSTFLLKSIRTWAIQLPISMSNRVYSTPPLVSKIPRHSAMSKHHLRRHQRFLRSLEVAGGDSKHQRVDDFMFLAFKLLQR